MSSDQIDKFKINKEEPVTYITSAGLDLVRGDWNRATEAIELALNKSLEDYANGKIDREKLDFEFTIGLDSLLYILSNLKRTQFKIQFINEGLNWIKQIASTYYMIPIPRLTSNLNKVAEIYKVVDNWFISEV